MRGRTRFFTTNEQASECHLLCFGMERFAADSMLGKLAKWLRVLGYDAVYLRGALDEEIRAGLLEGRIFLTRDRRALPWRNQGRVYMVSSNDPKEQLRDVIKGLSLPVLEELHFSRCITCNCPLRSVSRENVRENVPEYIWQNHDRFRRCDHCEKIYWSGTHLQKMRQHLGELFGSCKAERGMGNAERGTGNGECEI